MSDLAIQIALAIDKNIDYIHDNSGLRGVSRAIDDIVDVISTATRTVSDQIHDELRADTKARRARGEHIGCLDPFINQVFLLDQRLMSMTDVTPAAATEVDRVARAIARASNADAWVDEIAEWERREDWDREAHPDDYPESAFEDRDDFRIKAAAAIGAMTSSPATP